MQARMQDLAYKLLVLEWCEGFVHALKILPPLLWEGLRFDIPILISKGLDLAIVEDLLEVAVMEFSPTTLMMVGSPTMVDIHMEVESEIQSLAPGGAVHDTNDHWAWETSDSGALASYPVVKETWEDMMTSIVHTQQ